MTGVSRTSEIRACSKDCTRVVSTDWRSVTSRWSASKRSWRRGEFWNCRFDSRKTRRDSSAASSSLSASFTRPSTKVRSAAACD